MKKENDEDLDKLFRKGFDDPGNEPVYREADWEAMEEVLDKGKKRPAIIVLLPWLSIAAAVILVMLGWLLFRPQAEPGSNKNDKSIAAIKSQKENTGKSGGATRLQAADSSSSKQKLLTPAGYATNPVHHGEAPNTKRSYPYQQVVPAAKIPANAGVNLAASQTSVSKDKKEPRTGDSNNTAPDKKDLGTVDDKKNEVATNALANNSAAQTSQNEKKDLGTVDATASNSNITASNQTPAAPDKKDAGNTNSTAANKPKVKVKGVGLSRPVYAITAIGSSDMNGVNGMQGSRVGGNIGGLFSVTVSKWTFTTGAMYSIKPYEETDAQYNTGYVFKTAPSSIGVNCKMIDIPLNVNYQVYKNHGDKFTVGTGLSSYIILREDYSFYYSNPYTQGPASFSVINRNRNILGVLNLDATYDHQINSKFGISFQPYVKLPFSNVGESQAKLQSAGVAVGLSWNLNPFKKPN